MGIFRFWSRWDDEQRAVALKIVAVLVSAFTIFAMVSSVSYLFTWKSDQSLMTDPSMMDTGVDVSNSAGKLGFRFGAFLVGRCFGLGSFAIIFILAVISVRLLLRRRVLPLFKTTVVVLTGGFLVSLLLASVGNMAGLGNAFGCGLGGSLGAMVVGWGSNLFGSILTLVFILLLLFCWLLFSSRRFAHWVVGKRPAREPKEEDEEEELTPLPGEIDREPAPAAPSAAIAASGDAAVGAASGAGSSAGAATGAGVDGALAAAGSADPAADMEITRDEDFTAEVTEDLPRIDVRDELPRYKFPTLDILEDHSLGKMDVSTLELTRNNNQIRAALANYKIQVVDVKAVVGPTVTLYKVYPAPGVKIADIKRLQDDIALSLNAKGVRVVTLSDSVGIEVANDKPAIVPLKALLNDKEFRESKAELPVAIGYTITQKVKVFDLADAPHLLVAGATKQGKSVGLNVIVSSLLYAKHPSELKFVFIDPKMVEFSAYAKLLKHYLAVLPDAGDEEDEMQNAIVKKPKDAERILRSLCMEMDERYELLSKALVNNIVLYNDRYRDRKLNPQKGHRYLPYLVVVVDEYADLTMSAGGSAESKALSRSIQNSIVRLAQKGRAAGIHVILATQRPSVDVITGLIKSNFPCRIAFRVASRIDSITILDAPGAEKLIGKGDMLYYAGVDTERVQCGYVSNDEINTITAWIGEQTGFQKCFNTPLYLPEPAPAEGDAGGGPVDMTAVDERFEEAARLVYSMQKGSTSDLQRRLGMGFAKAGRVMDQLEAAGVVGPSQGSKPRAILVQNPDELEEIIRKFKH
ncbi:MAG: DNA translocase FtsK 4TM domain-containing protein [Bacteroidales bacterium]|nr:DNA translocase FtsK 4TM domain-containing protein [Bacteroidales bacterium]